MYRSCLYLSALAVILCASLVNADSVCTGYPKMYNGKPCASTTRYYDGQMGACGCGTGNTSPFSWQWTKPTAAASAPIFGSATWCGTGCGKCFKLTPTAIGASPDGTGAPALTSLVVKVTNLCPYGGNEAWCAYDTNSYGYDAHFDLMDYNMNGIVSSMGWNNPEVVYEEVDCAANGYTEWKCQCASGDGTASTATAAPTPASGNTGTKATTAAPKANTKATTAPTTAPKATTKAPTNAPKATTKAPTATPKAKSPTTAPKAPTKALSNKPRTEAPTAEATTPLKDAPGAATTAPAEATTAPVEDTPAPVEDTSASVEDTPAPVEDTPAPVEDTPAPVEDTPAPVEDTPAPVEDTPAPVEDTPAPVEDTPAPVDATTSAAAPGDDGSSSTVKIQLNGGSNNWWVGFSLVDITTVSSVSYVEIKDSSENASWNKLAYQGNEYWNMFSYNPSEQVVLPLSLRITSASGSVVTADDIITSFLATTVDTGVAV